MFSGVVKIADIDDYITPSQNCIKPISEPIKTSISNSTKKNDIYGKKTKIIIGSLNKGNEYDLENGLNFMEPDLIKIKNPETKSAKITLNDCLACSGCVTTAETLLIEAQSVEKFLSNSILENKISICCLSPQSIMSLSYYYNLEETEVVERLCSILEGIGIKFVFNFNTILKYNLEKSYEEFCERILEKKENYLICSECPGWICYAEKKIGDWVIPFLSRVKSPQQIIGNLLKNSFSQIFKDKEIYISCIMPCFDKKLEATRENPNIENNLEIDTVISTIEIFDLFSKLQIDFLNYKPVKKQKVFYSFSKFLNILNLFENENKSYESNIYLKYFEDNYEISQCEFRNFFYSQINFSSNGYVEYIIERYIQEKKLKENNFTYEIIRKNLKNSDFKEIELKIYKEEKLEKCYSFAMIYGFRNIQNLIRNKNKIKYQYLEVMACPGGCINGGGQMRAKDPNTETSREILKKIEEKVSLDINEQNSGKDFQNKIEDDLKFLKLFIQKKSNIEIYTQYKSIDKINNINIKW